MHGLLVPASVLSQVGGFLVGLATGLVTPFAVRWSRVARASIGNRRRSARDLDAFDSRSRGYYEINRWSLRRRLTPDRLDTKIRDAGPPQDWCDPTALAAIGAEITDRGGPSYYLVDYSVDHRETSAAQRFTTDLARSDFGDYVAVTRYFERHPEDLAKLKARAGREGIQRLVRTAPPSLVGMHVNVVSADGRFLVVERSGAVRENQHEWTVGPGESMTAAGDVPGGDDDFFGLARRALAEEVGLEPIHYREVHISWLGMYLERATSLVVAHVYSPLDSKSIDELIRTSHSLFEAARWEWPRLNRRTVNALHREMTAERAPRRWHAGAPIVLQELWRWRAVLEFD